MIYEIDESCINYLDGTNSEAIIFFEILAIERIKCHNIIVADRNVLIELSRKSFFSEPVRNLFKILSNRMSERNVVLEQASIYCRIVANEEVTHREENEKSIIIINVRVSANINVPMKTRLICESKDDIEFYNIVGNYYLEKNNAGKCGLDFEFINGGGQTSGKVFEKYIQEANYLCLCVVDSDQKCKGGKLGETMKLVQSVEKDYPKMFHDVIYLKVHEIENLIPLNLIEEVIKKRGLKKTGLNFLRFLTQEENDGDELMKYFDMKEGIRFVSKKDGKPREDAYKDCWIPILEDFGINNVDATTDRQYVAGICKSLLGFAIEEYSNETFGISFDNQEWLEALWLEYGAKIFSWGCVGSRIAI